jgi:ribonuclease-3
MGISNQERIGKALELLQQGLYPYFEQKIQAVYGSKWITKIASHLQDFQKPKKQAADVIQKDIAVLLKVMDREWNDVFKDSLSQSDRSLIYELLEVRNQWAHQEPFSIDDTYRAIDSVHRLLKAIEAPQVTDVEKQRQEVLRLLSQEQARYEVRPIPVSRAEDARIRERLDELLKRLAFQNAYLLNQALTHTSYMYENPGTGENNEKLEFIGDAVLTFLSADFLYKRNPDLKEGKMTVLRSNLVANDQLAQFANDLDLGKWIRIGRGEEISGGRTKPSLLSNVFEAVVGAYYLDSGMEAVRDWLEPLFEKIVNDLPTTEDSSSKLRDDVKGWFQQVVLSQEFSDKNPDRKPPKYDPIRSGGTDNSPEFTSVVYVAGVEYGKGKGRTKQDADKRAAEDALRRLGLLKN